MRRHEPSYQRRARWSASGTWSRERVIAALQDWAKTVGEAPRSYEWAPATADVLGLRSGRVALWEREYPRWPSAKTVCAYFGRWSVALDAAGLRPSRAVAAGFGRGKRVEAAQRMARAGLSAAAIATVLEISPRTVRDYLRAGRCLGCGIPVITAKRCPRCTARRSNKPRFAREQVVAAIRAWSEETGRTPRLEQWNPSSDRRRKWAREFPRWPSYMTVRTHFGSWAHALEAAGRTPNRRRWSQGTIIEALRDFEKASGRSPRHGDLGRGTLPAAATINKYFGSFATGLAAAGFSPERRRWSQARILSAIADFHRVAGRLPTTRDWRRSTAGHPHASTVRQQFGSWSRALGAYAKRT